MSNKYKFEIIFETEEFLTKEQLVELHARLIMKIQIEGMDFNPIKNCKSDIIFMGKEIKIGDILPIGVFNFKVLEKETKTIRGRWEHNGQIDTIDILIK